MVKQLGWMVCLIPFVACSSGTPRSLVDARAAYQRAAQGPAAQQTPAQLHVAQTALSVAEKTYDDEGDSHRARDRAYVAMRKAELAEVQAAIAQADQRTALAARQSAAARANQELATQHDLTSTRAQLAAEQQRRKDAERAAAEALAKLSSVASIKQETRGTVITLSGAVIFASGKSDLLPAARAKLDQVATALKKSDPGSKFEVEGYTDSRGSDALNLDLSTRRAAAVKNYLVSQGVPEDRITSRGLGESDPVADNETAEGRANNRRVEIIVKGDASQGQRNESAQPTTSTGPVPQSQSQSPSQSRTQDQQRATSQDGSQGSQQTGSRSQSQQGQARE